MSGPADLVAETNRVALGAPLLTVIVPARNAAATLDACLAALTASVGCAHETIVVDDASTDGTAAIAAGHGVRVVRLARQQGAAAARNVGARLAAADLLYFTDADVLVAPDTLARVVAQLQSAAADAVFGSYSAATVHTNFCSQYKNLMHHWTHQQASSAASTFWSGAGGVRAAAFWAAGGFDPADTATSDVEDIALGYRLRRAGYRIRLDRDLQVVHAKRYTLASLVRSDLAHRAIPWTRLMLRERQFQDDLNTDRGSLMSALCVLALGPAALGALWWPSLAAVAGGLALLFGWLNRRRFACLATRGPRFLLAGVAMTALYYGYAALGAAIGFALHLRDAVWRMGAPRRSCMAPPGAAAPLAETASA